jgi:general secretion pathway protein B
VSLILEALNRSARDRQTEPGAATPSLDTPAYLNEMEQQRRWPAYLTWAALVVALLVIAYLTLGYPGGQSSSKDLAMPESKLSEESTSAPEPILAQQAIPVDIPAAVPVSVEALPAEVVASDPAVDALYGDRVEVEEEEGGAANPSPAAVIELAKARPAPEAQLASKPVEKQAVTDQPIDIEEVLARTEEELKSTRLQEHSAPFITALSQRKKDAIPSILYRHHDYSSNASQSSVVLNGKTVKVGQAVTGGIRLDEILPDSIVLSHNGEQFRLRALNSWVNL